MKTSSPRTFSSIFTNVSPSGNGLIVHFPSSMPIYEQIASDKGWLDVPLKTFTMQVVCSKTKIHRNRWRTQAGLYQRVNPVQAEFGFCEAASPNNSKLVHSEAPKD